jgi:flagellar protein FlaG
MNIDILKNVKSEALATGDDKAAARVATAGAKQRAHAADEVERQSMQQRVQSAAAQIDSYLKSIGRALEFRVDDASGRLVVTVRDSQTGETIRQIPSEEALELARSLGQGGGAAALVKLTV